MVSVVNRVLPEALRLLSLVKVAEDLRCSIQFQEEEALYESCSYRHPSWIKEKTTGLIIITLLLKKEGYSASRQFFYVPASTQLISGVKVNGGCLQEIIADNAPLYTFCVSCGQPTVITEDFDEPSEYRCPKCRAFARGD